MRHYDAPASNGSGSVVAQSKNQDPASISLKIARAYANPVRARALMILGARVASPSEIAEEIGEPLGKVSYHVRELRDAGLIELVDTDQRRGGVQHFYRAAQLPIVDVEGMAAQDAEERAASSAVVINLMASDLTAAVEAGTLDSMPEQILIRYQAVLDEQAMAEMSDLYTSTLYRSIELHKEAAERRKHSKEPGIPVAMHTLVFEVPGAGEEPRPETIESTLEWADAGPSSFSTGGGSEGRGNDEGDAS